MSCFYITLSTISHLIKEINCSIITGVIQLIPPVLSSETLLHILLSSEYSGFRPSTTAVVTISAPVSVSTGPKFRRYVSAIITENCREGIYRYFQRVSNFLNI